MTPEQAVFNQYGVRLPPSPGDGKRRAFRIDQFRNGYLLKLRDTACFGSVIDDECFIWQNGDFWPMDKDCDWRKDSEEIQFEWMIWHAAKSMHRRGLKFSKTDQERLALAVQRLEAWL